MRQKLTTITQVGYARPSIYKCIHERSTIEAKVKMQTQNKVVEYIERHFKGQKLHVVFKHEWKSTTPQLYEFECRATIYKLWFERSTESGYEES